MSSLYDFATMTRSQTGARRPMVANGPPSSLIYHLLRKYRQEVDLLLVLRTPRCWYNCSFCDLPVTSRSFEVTPDEIYEQIRSAIRLYADALDVIDRISVSNNGSVLDARTLPEQALTNILQMANGLPSVTRIILETRPEFVVEPLAMLLRNSAPRLIIDYLIGFETLDDSLRNRVLRKGQSRQAVLDCLDVISLDSKAAATFFILLKPSLDHTDAEAVKETQASILWLSEACEQRGVNMSIRINPMYIDARTQWGKQALKGSYRPPRLTDALELAQWAEKCGVPAYIGLSDEGLAGPEQTFRAREDYSKALLHQAIFHNTHAPLLFQDGIA